jgi:hypothetical protein
MHIYNWYDQYKTMSNICKKTDYRDMVAFTIK